MELKTLSGHTIEDLTTYPTRAEVAEELGVSVSKVRTLERRGILHPICDAEGTHRFHPVEIQTVKREQSSEAFIDPEARAAGAVSMDLSNAQRLLDRILVPREKVDRYLFETLDRQAARIKELEAELSLAFKARRSALEAELSATRAAKDDQLTETVINRALPTLERLAVGIFGGRFAPPPGAPGAPPGSDFARMTRGQLELLLEVPEAWSADMLAQIRAAHAAAPADPEPKETPAP